MWCAMTASQPQEHSHEVSLDKMSSFLLMVF